MNGTEDRRQNYTVQSAAAEPPHAQAGPVAGQPHYGAAQTALPPPARSQDPRAKSPGLAGCLSCMPGLGQIYVGYYARGFIHVIVVGVLITLLATGDLDELTPLMAVFLAFFWLYNIIDAVRRAAAFNQYLAGASDIEMPDDFKVPKFGGSVLGGIVLIAFGSILLANTRWDVSLAWVKDWWPVAPILMGIYLLGKAAQERRAERSDQTER